MGRLLSLALVFAPLSLLSFGGGNGIIAAMHNQAVAVHRWMTDSEFIDLYAISRAAPGPGSLVVALVGWKAAGWLGAIVATLAMYLPSSVIVYGAGLVWNRYGGTAWRRALERGLAPIAVGLIFSGALAVLQAGHAGLLDIGTALATAALLLWRDASPYTLIGAAALLYGGLYATGLL